MNIQSRDSDSDSLLQDAYTRRPQGLKRTYVDIEDTEELKAAQSRSRGQFEDALRRNRLDLRQWLRYAQFEVEQKDLRRARSIFERAILVDRSYVPLWIRYVDVELRERNINHARNVLSRAIATLPRVSKLWYKYLYLEEALKNYEAVRALFEKWCSLEPEPSTWDAYIGFEIRQKSWNRVRSIFARYTSLYPHLTTWQTWKRFETSHGSIASIRAVYSKALDTLSSQYENGYSNDESVTKLIVEFAQWEAENQEFERCRALFEIARERWPSNHFITEGYIDFEKQYGTTSALRENLPQKRRLYYESLIDKNPRQYNNWWLYFDLIVSKFPQDSISALERLLLDKSKKPISFIKGSDWRQYVTFWLKCLNYIYLSLNESLKAKQLIEYLINEIIPHEKFTFAKVWVLNAQLELLEGNLSNMRQIFGRALGIQPKSKLFKSYIEIEIKLREFERVRRIYQKYIEFDYSNPKVWCEYAEFEQNLDEFERSRELHHIAIDSDKGFLHGRDKLIIIKHLILMETELRNFEEVENLYTKYLQLSDYDPKVWIQYAIHQSTISDDSYTDSTGYTAEYNDSETRFVLTEENKKKSRNIFEQALRYYRSIDDSINRALIMEAFKTYEDMYGNNESRRRLSERMPKKVIKTVIEDGLEEEVTKYEFPDDQTESKEDPQRLVNLAKIWERHKSARA